MEKRECGHTVGGDVSWHDQWANSPRVSQILKGELIWASSFLTPQSAAKGSETSDMEEKAALSWS